MNMKNSVFNCCVFFQGLEDNFPDEPEVIELSSDEEDDTKSLSRSDFGVLDSPPF